MKTSRLSRLLSFLFVLPFMLGTAMAGEVDKQIDQALGPIAKGIEKVVFFGFEVQGNFLPIVLVVLGGTAIFLTIYFKFINLTSIGLAMRTVKGKYTSPDAPGQITHFQALTAALSATVGLGNIAGVAVAVGIGGPGATFWMILMGLCGMTTKFCECTLGVKFRQIDSEGRVRGGAMYY
ncbi:MAG: alanine:cation symporter family protein, partial [Akkermansiaceae bacterium]